MHIYHILQIVKTLAATNSAAVPVPADGVTFFAPTDAAFISLLSNSGARLLMPADASLEAPVSDCSRNGPMANFDKFSSHTAR